MDNVALKALALLVVQFLQANPKLLQDLITNLLKQLEEQLKA